MGVVSLYRWQAGDKWELWAAVKTAWTAAWQGTFLCTVMFTFYIENFIFDFFRILDFVYHCTLTFHVSV